MLVVASPLSLQALPWMREPPKSVTWEWKGFQEPRALGNCLVAPESSLTSHHIPHWVMGKQS